MQPLFYQSFKNGKLESIADECYKRLKSCTLCPHNCNVNRLDGELGKCGIANDARVASYNAHYGEENVLVGKGGSGTIFFSGCNLRCIFCQNYDISHGEYGTNVTFHQLANIMLNLQEAGCSNINFVTPTHVLPFILYALVISAKQGLKLPLVYNSGGYESLEVIKMLDGIIDIYMPDIKFLDQNLAQQLTNAQDYPQIVKLALKEMHRQVGDLKVVNGLAKKGLLIRHLVMPGYLRETEEVIRFVAEEISKDSYLNIMGQYYPCGDANNFPKLSKRLYSSEYQQALQIARHYNLSKFII